MGLKAEPCVLRIKAIGPPLACEVDLELLEIETFSLPNQGCLQAVSGLVQPTSHSFVLSIAARKHLGGGRRGGRSVSCGRARMRRRWSKRIGKSGATSSSGDRDWVQRLAVVYA